MLDACFDPHLCRGGNHGNHPAGSGHGSLSAPRKRVPEFGSRTQATGRLFRTRAALPSSARTRTRTRSSSGSCGSSTERRERQQQRRRRRYKNKSRCCKNRRRQRRTAAATAAARIRTAVVVGVVFAGAAMGFGSADRSGAGPRGPRPRNLRDALRFQNQGVSRVQHRRRQRQQQRQRHDRGRGSPANTTREHSTTIFPYFSNLQKSQPNKNKNKRSLYVGRIAEQRRRKQEPNTARRRRRTGASPIHGESSVVVRTTVLLESVHGTPGVCLQLLAKHSNAFPARECLRIGLLLRSSSSSSSSFFLYY
mmetsp:Transcript_16496/g.34433  ORF Transcript_16496/g.34433 Transcript_16496/m.34433 type:complete len:308 (-) Transcript_16496:212-1135(-)